MSSKEVYLGGGTIWSIFEEQQKRLLRACPTLEEIITTTFELWKLTSSHPSALPIPVEITRFWNHALVVCLARSIGKPPTPPSPDNGLVQTIDRKEIERILTEQTPPKGEIQLLADWVWQVRNGNKNSTELEEKWDESMAQIIWALQKLQETG